MLHIKHTESSKVPIIFLVSPATFKTEKIQKHYLSSLVEKDCISISLPYEDGKAHIKTTVAPFIENLAEQIKPLETNTFIVNDSIYFKYLTKLKKVTHQEGSINPCKIKGLEHINVIYIPSFANAHYDPTVITKINYSISCINHWLKGTEESLDLNIYKIYRNEYDSLATLFEYLHTLPEVYFDIEGFSLNFWEAKIATFAFGLNKDTAYAVQCDFTTEKPFYSPNTIMREMLKDFLISYKGTLVLHNCYYDLEAIIFTLFMGEQWSNKLAMKDACTLLGSKVHDTRLISYLALNSTNRVKLDLKTLAFDYLGNYGLDVTDITKLPIDDLLEYNAKDVLATCYVKETYYPVLIKDSQLDIYNNLYKGTIPLYLEIEMTGLPLNPKTVREAGAELTSLRDSYLDSIYNSPEIIEYTDTLMQKESDKMHSKWKVKTAPIEDFDYVKFNPSSAIQVSGLLYEHMQLEVLDLTKSGNPATGAKTLTKLMNTVTDKEYKFCIESILKYKELDTIISTFINAFINKVVDKGDGRHYLHSSFNQAGTVSGRLSSAQVNLQNIPSTGTVHAKLIKSCIEAPEGYLFAGADYASLEDRISALTTKDTNKLKVYADGYDAHSLRAYTYYEEEMPDIKQKLDQAEIATTFWIDTEGEYHCE